MQSEDESPMSKPTLELEEEGFYVSVGELIAGKYRVEHVLGCGGMAFILSARHVELDQSFALKFLDERFLGNAKVIERFTLEARAASKLRSEHVARVYDVGVHGGAPFFVMEHLEGRDLAAVLADGGPLAVADAVEYVMQVCEALAVAHSEGIVHRDIKPENLFLVEREGPPLVKVLDFGISKVPLAAGEPASCHSAELTMGTPCYMSPEQIRSTASVDGRSDLWSLGVVLYELLAGREAFRADSVNATCAAILERDPPSLAQLRGDLPAGLVDIVMKCLEKSPERRFADVGELAGALLPFGPGRAVVSAERSSSVMRGARRASGSSDAPRSEAPFVRSVRPVVRVAEPARFARFARHVAMALVTIVTAALGLVTALRVIGDFPSTTSESSSTTSSASSSPSTPSSPSSSSTPSTASSETPAIALATAPRPVVELRDAALTPAAHAAHASPSASSSAPRAAALPSSAVHPRTSASAPVMARPPAPMANIELGY